MFGGNLEEAVGGPRPDSLPPVIRALLGGYHQDARCEALLLYRSGRFESIHPRHPCVHKDEIRTVQTAKLYSLLAVFRFAYYLKVRLPREHVQTQLSDKGVVVGDEQLGR
jgi:hypothetical protein